MPSSVASLKPRRSLQTSAIGRTAGASKIWSSNIRANTVTRFTSGSRPAASKLSLNDYRLRLLQREEATNRLSAIAPLADALISLGSPGPAPCGLESTGDSVFNSPASILGAPAVTVPMLAIEGMPVGIQIVGQRHTDARTAGIARWLFETVNPVSID